MSADTPRVTSATDTPAAGTSAKHTIQTAVTVLGFLLTAYLVASLTAGGATAAARAEATAVLAQDDAAAGAVVYSANCASCHQADGLGVVGSFPPLVGNPRAADADYVETVVREGLSGPIEVLGEPYDVEMQALDGLSDDEVSAVVAYVATLSARDPNAIPTTTSAEVEPGVVDEGRDLFVGSNRFDNGGAACVSCHTAGDVGNLGGWSLGPDLTDTLEVFGGEAGLAGWLSNPASPTMRPIFTDRPMTASEVADVVAFLGDAPEQSKPSDPGDGLILAGGVGFLILIGVMAFAWRGMRQTYAERLRSRR
jgi:mono/diheme cytochrome c family protein